MDVLLILLAIVYGVITLAVAGHSAVQYQINREFERDSRNETVQRENAYAARQSARRFFRAPLWPLTAIGGLVKMYAATRDPRDR